VSKAKLFLGLAVIVGMLAVSVAPAGAWFKALTAGATSGPFHAGVVTFTNQGATSTCEKLEGAWQIRTSGKISERGAGPGQQLTKEGPHLDVIISKWNKCTSFGFVGATISPCVLQIEQPNKGQTTALTLSVVTACTSVAPGNCELIIAPEAANEHLKTISIENSGVNLKANVSVTGVTSTSRSLGGLGCVGVKTLKNNEGGLKAEEMAGEKLNEV
jgi:hypothetical protein